MTETQATYDATGSVQGEMILEALRRSRHVEERVNAFLGNYDGFEPLTIEDITEALAKLISDMQQMKQAENRTAARSLDRIATALETIAGCVAITLGGEAFVVRMEPLP